MRKQRNIQGRVFDFCVLGLFTGKAPCLGARGGPENKYQWLTFEEVCPHPNLFFFLLGNGVLGNLFCLILVYQYINLIVQYGKSHEVYQVARGSTRAKCKIFENFYSAPNRCFYIGCFGSSGFCVKCCDFIKRFSFYSIVKIF